VDKDEFKRFLDREPDRGTIEYAARQSVDAGKATDDELLEAANGNKAAEKARGW
jgi:hypothetical protein